jgi:site-specific DNA-methyltransferase (adenine-specific)
LKTHEDILVFSAGGCSFGSIQPMVYNPQGVQKLNMRRVDKNKAGNHFDNKKVSVNHPLRHTSEYTQQFTNYPASIIKSKWEQGYHPTQKPVSLFSYLIKTYTNDGDIVLDNCLGSGTTAVAAYQTGRKCIGIEISEEYCDIAVKRIKEAVAQKTIALEV